MGAQKLYKQTLVIALVGSAGVLLGAGPDPSEAVADRVLEAPEPRAGAIRSEASDAEILPGGGPTSSAAESTRPAVAAPSDEKSAGASSESRPLGRPRESEPIRREADASADGLRGELRTLAALVGVVGAILSLAWVVRRTARARGGLAAAAGVGGRSPAGLLSVLGRYPIARGQTLILMRLDRRVLLLSQTWARGAARLSTLAEITDPEEVASILVKAQDAEGESVSERFKAIVERLNHEPPERAVTVVPPVVKADWFERTGAKARPTPKPAPGVPQPAAASHAARRPQAATTPVGVSADGAAALRSRLESMRTGGRPDR